MHEEYLRLAGDCKCLDGFQDIRSFLLLVGIPLLSAPLMAIVISSGRVCDLIRRLGFFKSADVDAIRCYTRHTRLPEPEQTGAP